MAENQHQAHGSSDAMRGGRAVLFATIASLIVGGPLLGMMGFTLLTTTTLLVVSAPLLLLFSPVLVPAALVLAGAMTGFGVAVLTAFVGLSALTWAVRSVGGLLMDSGGEKGMDYGQKGQAYEPRTWMNSGAAAS